jgi:putative DNA primase/helicase
MSADSPIDIAQQYIARGWAPLPVPHRSKNPGFEGWQKLRVTAETAAQYFNGTAQNIGVILGDASNGLMDVDLDTPEAIAAAPHILPDTFAVFGRSGAPEAHWLFRVTGNAPHTKPFRDPEVAADDKAMIVELRGTGAQTIFPGSTHKDTGEPIRWDSEGEPTVVDYSELVKLVSRVAVAGLLARHWDKGVRDPLCTATVGCLLRAGLEDEDIECLLRGIGDAADDEKIEERIADKILRLREALAVDGSVPGYPSLEDLTNKRVADAIRKWLTLPKKKDQPSPESLQLIMDRADTIITKPVVWLVPDMFAIGKTSMIAGDPGLAKSTITLDLVASVTNTPTYPWVGCVQGEVVILSAEDDPEDTIVPRLKAASADLTKIHIIRSVFSIEEDRPKRRNFNLKNDLELLEQSLAKHPSVVLIIIDPVSAYMSGTDSHVNTSVREVLAPVAEFAGRTHRAIVAVSHLNKGSGGNTNAMYRIMGSLGFVAAVRSVMLVARDQTDTGGKRRLFISVKNNNAPEPDGALAYHVENIDKIVRIVWHSDRVDVTAQEALESAPKTDRQEAIDNWLRAYLNAGPKPSKDVIDAGNAAGFGPRALTTAKDRIGIVSRRIEKPTDGSKPHWAWVLPVKGDGSDM